MTFSFKNFLLEEYLNETVSAVSNDDKGKLHELLLAKHLSADKEEKYLPQHFRAVSEESQNAGHAGTPEEVHDRIREKIGEENYALIDAHAAKTAKAYKDKLKAEGAIGNDSHIGEIHWTSNRDTDKKPGDHERLTGVKDINSNADLIATFHDSKGNIISRRGISAKYGSGEKPNYKNPGSASLEEMAGLRPGRIEEIMAPHHKLMENLGYYGSMKQRKSQYKVDALVAKHGARHIRNIVAVADIAKKNLEARKAVSREDQSLLREHAKELPYMKQFLDAHDAHPDPQQFVQSARDRAEMAEKSKRNHLAIVGKELQQGIMQRIGQTGEYDPKSVSKQLWEVIRNNVSPKTVIPHDVVHSWAQPNGDVEPIIKNSRNIADDHLHKFENLHVASDSRSNLIIRGTHKASGQVRSVATFGLKTQSGPHSSVLATLKL
jgi:hypothetical protein